MSSSRIYLLAVSIFLTISRATASYLVEGKVVIDESWDSIIYLSAINSLSQLNTASEEFIINFARIDEDGRFNLSGNNLPEEDRLYRLHLVKKGDPASTIIIGGKDENHIHFIMNGTSHITGATVKNGYLFSDYIFEGHPANDLLVDLRNLVKESKNPGGYPSETNREYQLNLYYDRLRSFADTCDHSLVSLLALQEIDIGQDFTGNRKFYSTLTSKLMSMASSPYIDEFLEQIAFLEFQTKPFVKTWLLAISAILVLGSILLFGHKRRQRKMSGTNQDLDELEKSLSYREQRILNLIVNGKSNKEISQLLHIEVSTVKSHIRNIYSKLNIRSRKEALSYTTHVQRLTTHE